MKTCLCCGTKAAADALTCANCGEGSWSVPEVWKDAPAWPVSSGEPKESTNIVPIPVAPIDPETIAEVPARRRAKKPS
jgi:hypothetical protein